MGSDRVWGLYNDLANLKEQLADARNWNTGAIPDISDRISITEREIAYEERRLDRQRKDQRK